MDTAGPTSRLERQHARARRSASTSPERDYVPPSTEQILAIARAQRRTRPAPEHDQAPGLAHPLPFTVTDLLPPERELFLRAFAGTSAFSRRKAVRAWQHKLRATREHARTGAGLAPTRVHDQRAEAITGRERDIAYETLRAPAAALYRQLGLRPPGNARDPAPKRHGAGPERWRPGWEVVRRGRRRPCQKRRTAAPCNGKLTLCHPPSEKWEKPK